MNKHIIEGITIYTGKDEMGDKWRVNNGGDDTVFLGVYNEDHDIVDLEKGADYIGALSLTREQAESLVESITEALKEEN